MENRVRKSTEYQEIQKIGAYIGGYSGGRYEVEIDLEGHKISWNHYDGELVDSAVNRIPPETARELLAKLERMRVLEWEEEYVDSGIMDGTQWTVEISLAGEKIAKQGSNCYPDEWGRFCRLIRKVSEKDFR